MDIATTEYKKLLPTLKDTQSEEERLMLLGGLTRAIITALSCHLLTEVGIKDIVQSKKDRWQPHMFKWVGTLNLRGPYP